MLARCRKNDVGGDVNNSEFFRLLLYRDYEKRFADGAKVPHRKISSEFRNGRPRRQQELPMPKIGPLFGEVLV